MAGGYEVGRGKPPVHTRFQAGASGNPKGRPKGMRNASTVILEAMRQKIAVNEGGRRRQITKLQAAVTNWPTRPQAATPGPSSS